jgi:hypothetical protein
VLYKKKEKNKERSLFSFIELANEERGDKGKIRNQFVSFLPSSFPACPLEIQI